MKQRLARRNAPGRERGSIMILVLVFSLFALVALLALADSGQKLTTLSNAYDIAGETARYAAGFIEPGSVQSGSPRIDAARAIPEAAAFATAAGAEDIMIDVAGDGLSVVVSLSLTGPDPITPGFNMTAEVQHQAFVLDGPGGPP